MKAKIAQKQEFGKLLVSDVAAIIWLMKYVKKPVAEAREFVVELRQCWQERGVPDFVKIEFCF